MLGQCLWNERLGPTLEVWSWIRHGTSSSPLGTVFDEGLFPNELKKKNNTHTNTQKTYCHTVRSQNAQAPTRSLPVGWDPALNQVTQLQPC